MQTIIELGKLLRDRAVSPVEVMRDCLSRIEALNPVLNAFITVTADSAREQAHQAEDQIQRGEWQGPLHGVPLAVKDLIDTAGVRTTAGSAVFKDRIPEEDAEVVRRLRQAGAVVLGKQNLHEFAYGGSSMVSHFGEVHNAWNPEFIAGGSSGGSAAAVAAGMCYGAIGTDTAGSIREPAAFCGIVGIKPTYGRVSSHGVVPLSWSLDHVGPLALCVADAAILLQTIAGYDEKDTTCANVPVDAYGERLGQATADLRIGVPRQYFYEDLDREIAAAVEHALDVIRTMTRQVREVELDVSTDRTLQSAESYAYHRESVAKSPEIYQPETLRRIKTGEKVAAADYIARRRELDMVRRRITEAFKDADLLITPTTPVPAAAVRELKENPESLRPREILMLRNTRPVNVWGLPAISIPCGFTGSGMPIGLQIIGRPWDEATVLRLAHAYEQATAWHKRMPALVQRD